MAIVEIPCHIVRGGTSKGVFIDASKLPEHGPERDQVLLKLMGSPDIRQIDGLGGADPLTSKVAIIAPSQRSDSQVDYLSGEVRIDKREVNYGIMCGNLASAVALVAHDLNFPTLSPSQQEVDIYNLNSGKPIKARLESSPDAESQFQYIKGAEQNVRLTFINPGGAVTGKLLPTGKSREKIVLSTTELECSIVDAGTLYAFFTASAFGLRGDESPVDLDNRTAFKETIERLRSVIAEHVNASPTLSRKIGVGNVKVAIVAPSENRNNGKAECDINARIINPLKTHKAYAVSGAVCIGAAAAIEGTIANGFVSSHGDQLRIGHPSGVMVVNTQIKVCQERLSFEAAQVHRTARILMRGTAYVPM